MTPARIVSATSLGVLFGLWFFATSALGATASSISQYGITWTFDGEYEYGRFANGDYWVVGPITITSIAPEFDGRHNGWEVNPVFSGPQGLEEGAGSFSAALVPALPYIALPGQSIVKGISINQDPGSAPDCYSTRCLQTAAVLTVLGSPPPNGGATVFRPPYVGPDKPFYSVADLRLDRLPSLPPVASAPSLSAVEAEFVRVQIDHKGGRMGRMIKPRDNMPDYGGDVAVKINDAVLRLTLNDPIENKMQALVNLVQSGIDRYHALLSGQTWPSGGGHEPGRKLSLAFTAVMLDHQGMKDAVRNSKFFSEDIGIARGTNNIGLFGFENFDLGEEKYWDYVKNDPGYNLERPDPYGYIDGGMNEVRDINGYQYCCLSKPWKASALAAYLMPEIVLLFDSPKFFNYVDRYVTFGVWTQPDPCAPVSQGGGPLLDAQGGYQKKCVLDPDLDPDSPLVKGTGPEFSCQAGRECGRYPSRHGTYRDAGYRSTAFQTAMWGAYRNIPSDTLAPAAPTNLTVQ